MMSLPVVELPSALPAASFLVPLLAGLVVLALSGFGSRFCGWVAVLTSGAMTAMGLAMARQVLGGVVLVTWGNELRVDGLSALLVLIVSALGLLASVYSIRYMQHSDVGSRGGIVAPGRRIQLFYALLLWCLGTMVWASVTNNIIMLWMAVEATTLTSGLLVAFFWDRRALEAGYKYMMLLTVGITFALFGCVVVYAAAAATGELAGREALLISEVRGVAGMIPAGTALIAVSMLIIGFGTKAGLAPFHPWLPDAHAEAPTPVSVLLSGVMIKVAFYALARTVGIFFPSLPAITLFAVGLGAFSMLLGVVLALAQDDLKRLLAYHSVSQMGYVLAGVGLGTYLGVYGGLFHLLNHALFKALLFMSAGAVIYATGARKVSELGGLARRMPLTCLAFLVGGLSIAGFPPFNGFMSKFTVYLALASAGLWWAVAAAILASTLTMVAILRKAYLVFWAAPVGDAARWESVREVPATMWVPMLVLAALCLLLGVAPGVAYGLLNDAAMLLANMGG
ncbi:MAG: proton-conducting transporter membrane subunit [Longimicrobiales bacterium]|nr:proton-conducting transporter membrane subunit [Longimicrobiales bacterium]